MGVLIFILVLVALIVVHEFGHFITAKWAGMRVEEFGLGYPPRALTLARRNGTDYTLNWLPFGGFVRIFGEDETEAVAPDAFSAKPRWAQALVLLAGIAMNVLFAWVLFSSALALGVPRALSDADAARTPDAHLAVTLVRAGSPAETAGLREGDLIERASAGAQTFERADASVFTTFVAEAGGPVALTVLRGGKELALSATPALGVIPSAPSRPGLGIGIAPVSSAPVPLLSAPVEGAVATVSATEEVASGLAGFFGSIFAGHADLSQVAGPVGIAGAVGTAAGNGLATLLSLTAVISINLALINLIPVPALDGGRLLFVLIETALRRPLPKGVASAANTVGFALLILLMLVVTAHDVFKIFS